MELVADRFVMNDERLATDLATGETARVIVESSGSPSEQLRWTLRCEWFAQLRHPSIAPLIDYGPIGETQRFEAWRCEAREGLSNHPWQETAQRMVAFLQSCGRTVADIAPSHLAAFERRTVIVPPSAAGFPGGTARPARCLPLSDHAVSLVGRRAVCALIDSIAQVEDAQPLLLALGGQQGTGLSTALDILLRMARTHGFAPLLLGRKVGADVLDRLAGRSLFLIDSGPAQNADRWRALLRWSLRSRRPHILLTVGPNASGRGCVTLDSVPVDMLVDAVVPPLTDAGLRATAERLARRSGGNPVRFARLVWRSGSASYSSRHVQSIAAEQGAPYAVTRSEPRQQEEPRVAQVESTRAARDLANATGLLEHGRHQAGTRLMKAAVAGLSRRSAWSKAAEGLVALSRSLLERGKPDAARQALHEADAAASHAANDPVLLDIAILTGVAWTDLARLDDAERTLSAAIAAANGWHDRDRLLLASLAMSRCLFWRGRFHEASQVVRFEAAPLPAAVRVRLSAAGARAAVGEGDMTRAIELANRALSAADDSGEARLTVVAGAAAALAHLAVGDRAAVTRDCDLVVHACRSSLDPLGALKIRLIASESARRAGDPRRASVLIARARRLSSSLPPLLQARLTLLERLAANQGDGHEIAGRHALQTGIGGLRVLAPLVHANRPQADLVDDVLDILWSCQTTDDDLAVLERVTVRLRARLRATAVAIVVPNQQGHAVLAGDTRMDGRMAHRVLDAGQTITPHQWDDAIEGGAPIRYGGALAGAIVVRWTVASAADPARAAAVLTMAAAAVGPVVAAVVARRNNATQPVTDELIGVSAAMAQIRRGVERAARAPFPVLIEGESGSGKELVARALHRRGPRRDRSFCTLNCAALPDDLVESELFGHARGAFTGALVERVGLFEEAHTGTLFLDEIGELSLRAQAKLLRALQEGEVRRVGENVARRIDVRIVAATNRRLHDEAAGGRFRIDLLYRLDVIRISIPPLRERREDIPPLVESLWQEAATRVGSRAVLTAATVGALAQYDWPGNVRELQNVLASLAVRAPRRGAIPPEGLPAPFSTTTNPEGSRLDDARRIFEERFVRSALVRTGGHRGRAARELGLTRQGLAKLMGRLNISTADAT